MRDWQSLNEGRVVMQRYDYSCGAAALATLMRYYFSDQVDERDLINDVSSLFDEAAGKRISSEGLSLLELQTIARNRGYQSASVRLEPSALAKLGGPVIVYLRTPDFRHYAVLRGLKDGKAWLADPSRGNLVMPLAAFLDEWHGETFVLGKEGFGVPGDFPLALDQASAPPVLPAPHDSTRRLSRFMRLPN